MPLQLRMAALAIAVIVAFSSLSVAQYHDDDDDGGYHQSMSPPRTPRKAGAPSGTKRNGPERLGENQYESRRPIRSETPAIRADSYNLRLCSILRKVRLMRGCMTPDSLEGLRA